MLRGVAGCYVTPRFVLRRVAAPDPTGTRLFYSKQDLNKQPTRFTFVQLLTVHLGTR